MVADLVSCSSRSSLATRIGVTPKEIGRWIKEEARPQGNHAAALREACVHFALNPGKYEGLRPIYVFGSSFDENKDGPEWLPPKPVVDLPRIPSKLWDLTPDSPLGIPACVLTANSKWIGRLGKFGFDVFTYKSVRTKALPPHSLPNLAYLPDLTVAQPVGGFPKSIYGTSHTSIDDVRMISLVNSFGMPSDEPRIWQADVTETRKLLAPNQVLIVSVVGTADSEAELVSDFAKVARLAAETRPDAVELNFSCPNVYGKEGSIYHNPELAARICKKVAAEIPEVKLVVKIGYLPLPQLRSLFEKVYRYIHGFAAINTVSTTILSAGQRPEPLFPAKDNGRKNGGVSGVAVNAHALSVVENLQRLCEQNRTELAILAMGGASSLEDVRQFMKSGAAIVQLCTAAMFNPLVALEIRQQWSGQSMLCGSRSLADSEVKFSDENVALAFERAFQVASRNRWPAEDVIESVQRHWVRRYKGSLATIRRGVDSPVKARSEAPSASQIEDWFKTDRHERLARTEGV